MVDWTRKVGVVGHTMHTAALRLRRRAWAPRPVGRRTVIRVVMRVLRGDVGRVLCADAVGLVLRAGIPGIGVAVAGVDGLMDVASTYCC